MSEAESPQRPTLAEKINYLFATVHPAGRGEFSNAEVERAVAADGGTGLSAAYLSQLRHGVKANPSMRMLEALARFFRVSPAYFFGDELSQKIVAELDVLAEIRDSDVRSVALRASGLSETSLDSIRAMLDHARRLERLPAHQRQQAARKSMQQPPSPPSPPPA